ncbi:MAG: hypothetical protein IKW79_01080 [Schwartzia sp.]|nr:hypothetical protein [Schwartzia sp. (in: firmicutes)]
MTLTLDISDAAAELIENHAALCNVSVSEFVVRTVLDRIERRSHVPRPKARDEMTDEEFEAMIEKSMEGVRQGKGRPAKEVFAELRKDLAAHGV